MAEKKKRKPVDPNETKRARFERLVNIRMTNCLSAMKNVGKLGNIDVYEVTEADVAKIEKTLATNSANTVKALRDGLAGKRAPEAGGFSI